MSLPHQSILRRFFAVAVSAAIAVCVLAFTLRSSDVKNEELVRIENAFLESKKGIESVQLPHELKADEFEPQGSIVRFKLNLFLHQAPSASSSLFIERVGLSGRVAINGEDIGSCGQGSLKNLRCLHQPLLLRIPTSALKKGDNVIDVDVYANSRQRNGLSTILFGPSDYLANKVYRSIRFWRYDFILATTWTTLSVGIIVLIVGVLHEAETLYFWFGIASILNALS